MFGCWRPNSTWEWEANRIFPPRAETLVNTAFACIAVNEINVFFKTYFQYGKRTRTIRLKRSIENSSLYLLAFIADKVIPLLYYFNSRLNKFEGNGPSRLFF